MRVGDDGSPVRSGAPLGGGQRVDVPVTLADIPLFTRVGGAARGRAAVAAPAQPPVAGPGLPPTGLPAAAPLAAVLVLGGGLVLRRRRSSTA